MIALLLAALMAAALQAPPGARAEEKLKVAVLQVQGVGLSETEIAAITDRFRESLSKTDRFILIDRSQLEAVLNEKALQQSVCAGTECTAKLGELAGAKRIVGGKAVKLGEGVWLFSALMVDVNTSETVGLESIRHRGDLLSLIETSVPELAGRLAGNPPGASQPAQKPDPTRKKKGPLKLAIFPSYLAGQNKERLVESHPKLMLSYEKMLQLEKVKGVKLSASFYPTQIYKGAYQKVRDSGWLEKLEKDSWEGLFLTTPNELLVYQAGRELGVDLVFMQRSYHNPGTQGGKHYQAFLFDINGLNVIHEKGSWKPYKLGRSMRGAMMRLIKRHRTSQ